MFVFPGMYEFSKTGQLLPILVGSAMPDPSGTDMQVPILGVDKDRNNGNLRPLGGTMEDPEGSGKYKRLDFETVVPDIIFYIHKCYVLIL